MMMINGKVNNILILLQVLLLLNKDKKFQFKIIKVNINNTKEIIWEDLPNNSNRRYKPEFHSRLLLYWSDPKGNVIR